MKLSANSQVIQCLICNQSFQENSQLVEHVNSEHLSVPQYNQSGMESTSYSTCFQCQICVKKYFSQAALSKHLKIQHQDQLPYTCQSCPEKFKYLGLLNQHAKTVHSLAVKTLHSCSTCCKAFTQKIHLQSHVKIVHQKERPYQCFICQTSFGCEGNLFRHVQIVHDKIKNFKCDTCHKTFGQRSHLTKHNRICSGDLLPEKQDRHALTETPKKSNHHNMNKNETRQAIDNLIGQIQIPLAVINPPFSHTELSSQVKRETPKNERSPPVYKAAKSKRVQRSSHGTAIKRELTYQEKRGAKNDVTSLLTGLSRNNSITIVNRNDVQTKPVIQSPHNYKRDINCNSPSQMTTIYNSPQLPGQFSNFVHSDQVFTDIKEDFRKRVYHTFKGQSKVEIVNTIVSGVLHPSDLTSIVRDAEEAGIKVSDLIQAIVQNFQEKGPSALPIPKFRFSML